MKTGLWALPAVLKLVLAGQHAFSVQDDLLAFPQYRIKFPDRYVAESQAALHLSSAADTTDTSADSRDTQILSRDKQADDGDFTYNDESSDSPATHELLKLEGQDFLCRIPTVAPPAQLNETESRASAEEEANELARANDRGWELLQGMQGDCIYHMSGWWSYSFCYNKEIKQFHHLPPSKGIPLYPPTEDPSVHSYVLGRFPQKGGTEKRAQVDDIKDEPSEEKSLTRLETKGESRYMVQRLGDGTECDLTGKERRIEVQFHCHPSASDRIGMIKEVSTCSYLMVIQTPRLCNDVAFLPPQKDKPNTISCEIIVPDDGLSELTSRLEQVNEVSKEMTAAASKPTVPLRPVIGGIPVGAQHLVGKSGREIEKGVVVGGGKEFLLGTLAASDGFMMSEREMRQYEIRVKEIEKAKRDLSRLAKGQVWRLDLVDTPRGREFRGIIETADVKEDEDADGQEGSEEVYKEDL
ncbi:hypothetical protein EJ05DRAFT_75077 [Pseudovirgaria hyperparasitica]|uniref:Endoplasmic reticulum lectin n=1 Tax=Pseudovirgaria hyperparasitica TaxID=470096 RepID=A0A6A6W495_9PEZI|nr:uncharacterized protein EJ05DRAFT_75077 [Pseudovirgaria hyperparasitica]KAF2756730.1 hypothetical protein EJ05DRAFT_75077 [Pseudovirgaria hyperparasitica]